MELVRRAAGDKLLASPPHSGNVGRGVIRMPRNPRPSGRIRSAAKAGRINSIVDFAKHLDLSVWTVSRAINGHPEVKELTRRRVLAAMDEVGYRPNPLARGLGGRRTGMIGVCSIGIENPILNAKIYHLQEFLRPHGLRILLEMAPQHSPDETRAIDDFARLHVDGVVLMYSALTSENVGRLLPGVATVQVDPHRPQNLPNISIDRRKAMRLLFEHLLHFGHRSFALLFAHSDPWRWPALTEVARDHGLDPQKIFRFVEAPPGAGPLQAGQIMTEELLRWPKRPTAILARDDRMALGVIQAVRQAGLQVPADMSVAGFDNLDLARQLHPTLTTVDQNPALLMKQAVAMLLAEIALPPKRRGRAQTETISPELVTGESTGPARR
jgi:DNA-binding LacI/PurR family transcriptional regulator